MGRVHHMERRPNNAKICAWLDWYDVHGPVDIVLVSSNGATCNRTDADQLVEYAKGRRRLPDGSWIVTNPADVVTEAQTAKTSAHGHESAVDVNPVRSLYSSGGVREIYLADARKESPDDFKEARRRFRLVIDTIGDYDLESGEHFPVPDMPHVQDRLWKTNALGPGVAA